MLREMQLARRPLDLIKGCLGLMIFHLEEIWKRQILLHHLIVNIMYFILRSELSHLLTSHHARAPMLILNRSEEISRRVRTGSLSASMMQPFVLLQLLSHVYIILNHWLL